MGKESVGFYYCCCNYNYCFKSEQYVRKPCSRDLGALFPQKVWNYLSGLSILLDKKRFVNYLFYPDHSNQSHHVRPREVTSSFDDEIRTGVIGVSSNRQLFGDILYNLKYVLSSTVINILWHMAEIPKAFFITYF